MSDNNNDIPTADIPKGIIPTTGMKLKEQYEKAKKEGTIINNGQTNKPQQPTQPAKPQISPEEENRRAIIKHLALKTEYKLIVNGETMTKKRLFCKPKEHFELFNLTSFHDAIIAETTNLERRRIILNAQLTILGRNLDNLELLEKYEKLLNQADALNEKISNKDWSYIDNDTNETMHFRSYVAFADYLYGKILEYCIGLTPEEYNNSAMSSSQEYINNDIWGTRHIADACLELEQKTYSYFQIPSKSSSNI